MQTSIARFVEKHFKPASHPLAAMALMAGVALCSTLAHAQDGASAPAAPTATKNAKDTDAKAAPVPVGVIYYDEATRSLQGVLGGNNATSAQDENVFPGYVFPGFLYYNAEANQLVALPSGNYVAACDCTIIKAEEWKNSFGKQFLYSSSADFHERRDEWGRMRDNMNVLVKEFFANHHREAPQDREEWKYLYGHAKDHWDSDEDRAQALRDFRSRKPPLPLPSSAEILEMDDAPGLPAPAEIAASSGKVASGAAANFATAKFSILVVDNNENDVPNYKGTTKKNRVLVLSKATEPLYAGLSMSTEQLEIWRHNSCEGECGPGSDQDKIAAIKVFAAKICASSTPLQAELWHNNSKTGTVPFESEFVGEAPQKFCNALRTTGLTNHS